jgi:hypothetical protein
MAALAHGTGTHLLPASHAQASGVAVAPDAAAASTAAAAAAAAAAPCDGEEARVPVNMHPSDAFSWRALLSFVGALQSSSVAAMHFFVSARVTLRARRAG